jgi:nucleoside-diphosphate-sugar epimerase
MVWGNRIQYFPGGNVAVNIIYNLMNGRIPLVPNVFFGGAVEVSDTSRAIIAAMEHPTVLSGRYIVSREGISILEMCQILKKQYPHLSFPTKTHPRWLLLIALYFFQWNDFWWMWYNIDRVHGYNNQKFLKDFGFQYEHTVEEAVLDEAASLVRAGFVNPKTPEKRAHQQHLRTALGCIVAGATAVSLFYYFK